ncbi:uncharacterized protein LOC130814967 [Amaranthus tricolor]|uniref:uncharacterized protein LOC130814967 n=1 Tax=Amaranthus tricolor TaxID=29722 RepID=UPI00258B3A31|nr:uncharacterized protein LOC130814967 [Amaranthus tricolor]
MAPKRNPTQTATVHSTDTDTSAGHANNQAVTRRDLDMLARNLTAAFSEQLRAVINNTPTQQRVLEDMANQIKNLQERIEPHQEIPKSHESQDGNSRTSHSSRRNKKRRERSRTHPSLKWTDQRDDESKTTSRDARTYLESKKQRASESVQSLVDKRREERKKAQLAGSSRPISPVTMPRNEDGRSRLHEDLTPIISPLALEILNTPNPGKIKRSQTWRPSMEHPARRNT